MQIGRRIYFELSTGNVIQDTGEREGSVVETTEEEDFLSFISLSERVPETVGMIQLEYGEFAQDFMESNGHRVNLLTGLLEFSYPDPSNPQPPVFQTPLSVKVAQQTSQLASINADMSSFMDFVLEALGLA